MRSWGTADVVGDRAGAVVHGGRGAVVALGALADAAVEGLAAPLNHAPLPARWKLPMAPDRAATHAARLMDRLPLVGYDMHITRAAPWPNSAEFPIAQAEWEAVADAWPGLTRAGNAYIIELGGIPVQLDWRDSEIITTAGRAPVGELARIAERLGAYLLGDEGERYMLDGEPIRDAALENITPPTLTDSTVVESADDEAPVADRSTTVTAEQADTLRAWSNRFRS